MTCYTGVHVSLWRGNGRRIRWKWYKRTNGHECERCLFGHKSEIQEPERWKWHNYFKQKTSFGKPIKQIAASSSWLQYVFHNHSFSSLFPSFGHTFPSSQLTLLLLQIHCHDVLRDMWWMKFPLTGIYNRIRLITRRPAHILQAQIGPHLLPLKTTARSRLYLALPIGICHASKAPFKSPQTQWDVHGANKRRLLTVTFHAAWPNLHLPQTKCLWCRALALQSLRVTWS